jgi:nicotinamide mononucleotide transporter
MPINNWLSNNYVEVFGAITGIVYVFLEIRQTIWLWPVGIITSAVYIIVFFTSKFYADMSLQVYYLIISCIGWYWWAMGTNLRLSCGWLSRANRVLRSLGEGGGHRDQSAGKSIGNEGVSVRKGEGENGRSDSETDGLRDEEKVKLVVTRIKLKTGVFLAIVFVILYVLMYFILSRMTDSPVPEVDSFITSLSIVATWMLARKIYEHWYLWIVVNCVSVALFSVRGLYPTVILYLVYGIMSFAGLVEWKKTIAGKS